MIFIFYHYDHKTKPIYPHHKPLHTTINYPHPKLATTRPLNHRHHQTPHKPQNLPENTLSYT